MFHHLRTFIVLFSFQLGKARESAADANLIFFTVFSSKFCFKQVLKNRASRVER
ncbi:MAG: hypothetical protein RIQ94_780 [Pseudomonadota bacterium]